MKENLTGDVGDEVSVPGEETIVGNNLVSAKDTHTSLDSGLVTDESNVEQSVEATDGKPAGIEKPPRRKILGVLDPGNMDVPGHDASPSNAEPIYENVPPKLDDEQSQYAPPEYVPPSDTSLYDVPRQNVPEVDIEGAKTDYGYLPMDNPPSESNGVSSEKSVTAQGMYTVILPDDKKQDSLGSETGNELLMNQSTKRNPRTMSYVVVSAGEGHVDLRMKLKSKSEIKKDFQTKLLIWRVNNKA